MLYGTTLGYLYDPAMPTLQGQAIISAYFDA